MGELLSRVPLVLVAVVLLVMAVAVQRLRQKNEDKRAPLRTVRVVVVSRRREKDAGYVTVEAPNGVSQEFLVENKDYEAMPEGTLGKITFKGSQFVAFEKLEEAIEA